MHDFAVPPLAFAPLLSYRWNDAPSPDDARQLLARLSDAGCGGAIFHAARGLSLPYLGTDWMNLVRAALSECRARELQAWLGDDLDRSGEVGGLIPHERPDLRAHFLQFALQDVPRQDAAAWRPVTQPGLLYIIGAPLVNGRPDFTQAVALSDVTPERATQRLTKLNADARIYTFAQSSDSYIDLLNPEAARLFLQSTHEAYRQRLGLDFRALSGFYAQGVTLWPDKPYNEERRRFPWSLHFAENFSQAPGYNLLEWLPALIADIGDDAARLRQDYWEAVARLSRDGFWNLTAHWAHSQGLSYAASFEGAPLNDAIASQADPVSALRAIDVPVVSVGAALDAAGAMGAKLAVSVAALQGKARVMAEIGRGAGWGATLGERLPVLHHLLGRGVNAFACGQSFASLRGGRALDEPPSETHQPYWAQWKTWAAYVARCSQMLAQGKAGAQVALLWPSRSAQAHHHPQGHRLTRWVEEDLYTTAQLLDELHFDWLFLPEDDLSGGEVDGARLQCGAAKLPFEMLILPSVSALSWDAWRKIEAFVASGGKVASLGLLPRWSERGRDVELEEHISKHTLLTIGDIYDLYVQQERDGNSTPTFPICREAPAGGGRMCCYQPRLNPDADDARLRVLKILKESLAPALETQSKSILYTRRIIEASVETPAPAPEVAVVEPDAAPESPRWDREFDWDADENGTPPPAEAESEEQPVDSEAESESEAGDALILADDTPLAEQFGDGGDVFFIFNTSDEATRANMRLLSSQHAQNGVPHLMDAWTGEVKPLPVWMRYPEEEGGGLSLGLDFAPHQAHLLWLRPPLKADSHAANIERATFVVEDWDGRVAAGYAQESGMPRIAVRTSDGKLVRHVADSVTIPAPILLEDPWNATRQSPNVLLCAGWQWQKGRHAPGGLRNLLGENWQPLPPRRAPEPPFETLGVITFRTTFEVNAAPRELFWCLDAPDAPHTVFLNGEKLEAIECPYPDDPLWGDAGWQWFDLQSAQEGENALLCIADFRGRSTGRDEGLSLAPGTARLVGDFLLDDMLAIGPGGSLLLDDGSWHAQGLPFYSGALDLQQWVNVPLSWNGCRVFLEVSRARDAVGVYLNGRACGVKLTAPYRFDVSRLVLKGASNELRVRIWNTSEAALEGNARQPLPSGLLGPARLVAYPRVYPVAETKH